MSVLSKLRSSNVRETASDASREAMRHAGRGARRGAKRGAAVGAVKGTGESAFKQVTRAPRRAVDGLIAERRKRERRRTAKRVATAGAATAAAGAGAYLSRDKIAKLIKRDRSGQPQEPAPVSAGQAGGITGEPASDTAEKATANHSAGTAA